MSDQDNARRFRVGRRSNVRFGSYFSCIGCGVSVDAAFQRSPNLIHARSQLLGPWWRGSESKRGQRSPGFNARLHDELLDGEILYLLREADRY
jgi:hypothetical protein